MQRLCVVHTLLASAERGEATYTSEWKKVGWAIEAQLAISATAENGTATLNVTVQTSPDKSILLTHTTCTEIDAVGTQLQKLTNMGQWIRVSAIVAGTGTPKFTFSIHLTPKS